MILEKICERTVEQIKDKEKKIVCYVKVPEYIREMQEKYDLLHMIDFILEEHDKRLGDCECEGISIPVYSALRLNDIDWSQYTLVITSEYYREVFETLQKNENVRKGLSTVYYYADAEIEYYDYYADLYQEKVLENIIIFRSGPRKDAIQKGMDFDDNARALFEYMLGKGFNQEYKLIWLVKNPGELSKYSDYYNVKFISMDWAVSEISEEREQYYYSVCLAKYIFFTDAFSFARNARAGQTRVQLWHGQGFKTRAIFSSFRRRCEYMTVMSEFYAELHEKIFDLSKQQVLITGNPKQDWLFHRVKRERLYSLGIPESQKYIFWLPTFRKAVQGLERLNGNTPVSVTGMSVMDDFDQVDYLNGLLKKSDITLVIKLHPAQDETQVANIESSNIILLKQEKLAEENLHINQLLGYADALISDYSSVAVDYLLLNRPIGFALEDLHEYRKSRGLHFDDMEEWIPGKELFTFEQLCEFVNEIAEDIDSSYEKRQRISSIMCKWKDDRNSERVLEALGIGENS